MEIAREDFNVRTSQIERYFVFLSQLDKDHAILHFSEMGKDYTAPIDDELLKIIKANGFLLIYNLVESSCRNSLLAISTAIQSKSITYKKLTIKTQKVWIKHCVRNYKSANTGIGSIEKLFYDVASAILSDQVIDFGIVPADRVSDDEDDDKDYFDLSGNIDARKIKELANSYGFSSDVGTAVKAESTLLLVKRMRNKLAHGRITFAESVKDKSVQDMIKYKDQVIAYMECVLSNVSNYLDSSDFRQPTATGL